MTKVRAFVGATLFGLIIAAATTTGASATTSALSPVSDGGVNASVQVTSGVTLLPEGGEFTGKNGNVVTWQTVLDGVPSEITVAL